MRRRGLFSRGGSASAAKLSTASLAPMVDMLTILVVAVLRTWSTDPPVEIPEANFSLPISAQEVELNGKLRLLSGDGAVIFVSLLSEFTQGKRIVRPKPCASSSFA